MVAAMQSQRSRSSREERKASPADRRTLVVGLGATGLAAARYLIGLGERVLVVDSRPNPPCLEALRSEHPRVPIELGTLDPKWLAGASRVVWSPGLGADIPLAVEARRRGIELVSDIELFARAANAPVLAVTGSNGKSTVTTLTAHMLAAAGFNAPAGGNLGPPALDLLATAGAAGTGPGDPAGTGPGDRGLGAGPGHPGSADAGDAAELAGSRAPRAGRCGPDAYVLEVSSFQMETTESLRPLAAAVLNVSADHLDRHGDIEHYASLKAKLLGAADYAVFNRDDPLVRPVGERCARPIPFSTQTRLERGYSVIETAGGWWLARDGSPLVAVAELSLRGLHNEANALAALALTVTFLEAEGAPADALEAAIGALRRFEGLPHRCRPVGVHDGVEYIDDSKGTNVGATLAALAGFSGPLILIAGGLGKGADFAPLAEAARGKVKAAVLIGAAAPEIEAALRGVCPTRTEADMGKAVRTAAALAAPGDIVLLSPACASLDMFSDYKHRGEAFAAAVRELPG